MADFKARGRRLHSSADGGGRGIAGRPAGRSAMAVLNTVSVTDLRRAVEGRDSKALAEFSRDDAVVRIIDRDHPPSTPHEIRGREAIAAFFDDICGRDMTHRLETGLADGDRIAYT
jgi:hypothetical protein